MVESHSSRVRDMTYLPTLESAVYLFHLELTSKIVDINLVIM
jgi:hypothetical protein